MVLVCDRGAEQCEDTIAGRLNAKLHWEVELWPPVPISPARSNPANGHFYVLLSPATWTWSERAAIDECAERAFFAAEGAHRNFGVRRKQRAFPARRRHDV